MSKNKHINAKTVRVYLCINVLRHQRGYLNTGSAGGSTISRVYKMLITKTIELTVE
jgi:hypothetical protein